MIANADHKNVPANGINICFADHGDRKHPVILLIMGLGMQMTAWPPELIDALVVRGFRVVIFDNRDVGLSTKFDTAPVPDLRRLALRSLFRLPVRAHYGLGDMANDAVALLDALSIDRAHVVGASMGGMIAQHIAARHVMRTASLTSIMSSTGNRRLPRPSRAALAVLTDRPKNGSIDEIVAFSKRAARVIGSPAYPADDARLDRRIRNDYARSSYPAGFARQVAAIVADGDRRPMLKRISAPTLVIHGADDPLAPVAGGRDTAASITGAKLNIIAGMGHDLPLALVDTIADAISEHARGAALEAA